MKKERNSELTFKDICNSNFGGFTKVVWNGKLIFDDNIQEEIMFKNPDNKIVQCYSTAIVKKIGYKSLDSMLEKYSNKKIYSFYCCVVDFHHTELYIEGEE